MKIQTALDNYIEYLKGLGKSDITIYSYSKDAEQIAAFFGERNLDELTKLWVGRFLKSGELNKRPNGKGRAPNTVKKTIGFFRRFIIWSQEQGWLEEYPLPKEIAPKPVNAG